jgi:hypothetical protein
MIPAAVIGLPVAAMILGTENQAMVAKSSRPSGAELEKAAALLTRYDPRQMTIGEVTTIIAREDELNSALTAGLADYYPIRMRVAVDAGGVRIKATARLPAGAGPVGQYVNLAATIAPSRRGLNITRFRVGTMELPKALATPAMQILFEALLGPGMGAQLLDNIQSVDITGKTVAIGYRAPGRRARLARTRARRSSEPMIVKIQLVPDTPKPAYTGSEIDSETVARRESSGPPGPVEPPNDTASEIPGEPSGARN